MNPSQPREFALVFDENPLAEFVELPEEALASNQPGSSKEGLWYSNVLCGAIRGALEMVCGVDCCFPVSFPNADSDSRAHN